MTNPDIMKYAFFLLATKHMATKIIPIIRPVEKFSAMISPNSGEINSATLRKPHILSSLLGARFTI
jgi:hypothetical protein